MTVKTIFFLFTVLIFNQSLLHAGWVINKEVDSMTDKKTTSAVLSNDEGYELKLYTLASGEFFCTFALPTNSLDVLSHSQAPMYRVDKNIQQDLNDLAKMHDKLIEHGAYLYSQEPKWCNFILSAVEKKNRDTISGWVLEEFAKGEKIVFRYWLFTGGYKETSFSISGADKAILEVLKNKHSSN
tara:strand:+ start:151 stop:702 length:552 start_codon:yes stop_codon:yes gene_type:complete